MDKENVMCVYTYTHTQIHTDTMEYYLAIKSNKNGSFVETWMDVETFIQNEVKEKNKYCILMHNC